MVLKYNYCVLLRYCYDSVYSNHEGTFINTVTQSGIFSTEETSRGSFYNIIAIQLCPYGVKYAGTVFKAALKCYFVILCRSKI
ncbi:hypothetical protein VIGAN_08261800 [Vigna angularis var. angularis]|uniref:Uncharacterized protein n=1 Tax=Vigna angularis var. angularis TaxID=157739 RepID=A0A0S3SSL5_PHAAN|nr:hypothetical protein VIGAN_08261800 [Vigna angularis var. angularis]